MINKNLYIVLMVFLASCVGKSKKESKQTPGIKKEKAESCISDKAKIFLSFWTGMKEKEFYCVAQELTRKRELLSNAKGFFYLIGNDSLRINPLFGNNGQLERIILNYPLPSYPVVSITGGARIMEKYILSNSVAQLENTLSEKYGQPSIIKANISASIKSNISKWQKDDKIIILQKYFQPLRTTSGLSDKDYVTNMTISYTDVIIEDRIKIETDENSKAMQAKSDQQLNNL